MAFSWYIERRGKQFGPYTGTKLKELAASGRLQRTDLVRRDDQPTWMAAAKIKGLFTVSETASPPPLSTANVVGTSPVGSGTSPAPKTPPASAVPGSPTDDSATKPPETRFTRIDSHLRGMVETTKAAARLAAAHARKAHLANVTLPAAYLELGRDIFASGRFREEFPDLFSRITASQEERQRLGDVRVDGERQRSLSEKATDASSRVKVTAQAKLVALKEESLLRQLGESSYERHGEHSGPDDSVRPIAECRSRLEDLDREIERLSGIGHGRFVTPRKVLVGALGCGVIVIGLMALTPRAKDGSTRKELVALQPFRSDEPKRNAGVVFADSGVRASDRTGASGKSSSSQAIGAREGQGGSGGAGSPKGQSGGQLRSTIARPVGDADSTVPVPAKAAYHHDFSKDDYESIPEGAKRTTRAKIMAKADLDETEVGDEGLLGRWVVEEGYTNSRSEFQRHGKRIIWSSEAMQNRLREDRWLDGRCHGLRITWFENGSKWGEATFVHGKLHGKSRRWYEDGKSKGETVHLNGKKNGPSTNWFSNGEKESEVAYLDDVVDGPARFWFEDGQIKEESSSSKGKYHGTLTRYFRYGPDKRHPIGTALMELGKVVKPMVVASQVTKAEFIRSMDYGSLGDGRAAWFGVWWENEWMVGFGEPDRSTGEGLGKNGQHVVYFCSDGPVSLHFKSGVMSRGQIVLELDE